MKQFPFKLVSRSNHKWKEPKYVKQWYYDDTSTLLIIRYIWYYFCEIKSKRFSLYGNAATWSRSLGRSGGKWFILIQYLSIKNNASNVWTYQLHFLTDRFYNPCNCNFINYSYWYNCYDILLYESRWQYYYKNIKIKRKWQHQVSTIFLNILLKS